MKVAGSYASLLRGVSQQPPEVRQPGQHTEQVNMLSDPVAGLTRRQGSRFQGAKDLGTISSGTALSQFATANGYRTINQVQGTRELMILMKSEGTANSLANSLPPVICYDIDQKMFLAVSYVGGYTGTGGLPINANGIAAATPLGRYIVFAQKNKVGTFPFIPPYPSNGLSHPTVVWIRGGAFDRTYTITISSVGYNYTTPAAGVAGAATAISPQNIAAQLNAVLTGNGFSTILKGSHILINGTPLVDVTDGGDGSLIRAVDFGGIEDNTKLTLFGQQDQVVQVGKSAGSPGYYLKADPYGSSTFGEVVWRESAGDERFGHMIDNVGMATAEGNTFYVGHFQTSFDDSGLSAVIGSTAPQFVDSFAGDEDSNPTPKWMRGQITYLGTFQDRLLVGCGATLSVSAAGDYFNFFRSTVVTVPAKDPFEMVPQGGEDDVLRHSVAYNRNLVIFGDKKQYIISGTQALTPTSPNMAIMTVYADASTAPPVAAGGQIYYARNRDGAVALHQIQPGTYVDSAESFPSSAQIGTYMTAPVAELESLAGAPAMMLVRSRSKPNDLYTFSYLDAPDGRKQDAWSRWVYSPLCGNLLGVMAVPDGVMLLWARYANGKMWLVADLQSVNPELSNLPYFDSARTRATVTAGLTDVVTDQAGWSIAFDNTTDRFLIGGDLDEASTLAVEYPTEAPSLWAGVNYDSFVTPTNPYQRDGTGRAILSGRTVITRLLLSLRRTAGMDATVTSANTTTLYSFNGRILGDLLNQIGKVPVSDSQHTVSIGREGREYTAKLAAQRWYPYTVVGIEFTGQAFNRTPRA